MAQTSLDIRQSETRILQDQLDSAIVTAMDSVLASINNELTQPARLIAAATPSLVVTVGSGTVVNPNTSKNRVLPFINNTPVAFTGGTITFPSGTGNITTSPGTTYPITVGASQYIAVLVQLDTSGNIEVSVGAAAGSLGAVVIPTGNASLLSLGYVIIQSNGSSVVQNITNGMLYQFAVGSGGGGGAVVTFTLANNQSSPANITNFLVNSATANGFSAEYSIIRSYNGTVSEVLTENLSVTGYELNIASSTTWQGQKFTPTTSGSLTSITVELSATGSPTGNIICYIYNDSGGSLGSLVATSNSINAATLTGSYANYVFTFGSPPSLTSGTPYFFFFKGSDLTSSFGSNSYGFNTSYNSNPYTGGSNYNSTNSGSSINADTLASLYFIATGNVATVSEVLAQGTLRGTYSQLNSSWYIGGQTSFTPFGDPGIVFSITSGGQVQYTSTNILGTLVASTLKFSIKNL